MNPEPWLYPTIPHVACIEGRAGKPPWRETSVPQGTRKPCKLNIQKLSVYIIESWPSRIRGKKGKEVQPWTRRRETGLHISCKIVLTFGWKLACSTCSPRRQLPSASYRGNHSCAPSFNLPYSVIHMHEKRGGRERERERRGEKGECITEREMRELYEALHESRSFQSAWVEFSAIFLCVYLTVYVRRVWKNCFSSMEKTQTITLQWVVIRCLRVCICMNREAG